MREPVGVVGAITPWNYPLHQIAAKVAPALAAGCTVVLKPSEVAPLNAFILAEIIDEAGAAGRACFNLVTGTGPVVGEAIAAHPDVDMVSFTGSTRAGRRVSELAAQTVKRVALELGGKSPNVILDDADLETAVADGVAKCFLNSGQTCSALTRMLVPRERLAEAERDRRRRSRSAYTVGDPFDESTRARPARLRRRSASACAATSSKGVEEGAKLVTGGAEPPEGLERGYFVQPTVFSDVTQRHDDRAGGDLRPGAVDHPLRRRGRRGPDRQRLASTGSPAACGRPTRSARKRVARRIRTGQVEINGGVFNPLAPFGGYKQSGHGRELGRYGARGVPRGEVDAALTGERSAQAVVGAGSATPSAGRPLPRTAGRSRRTVAARRLGLTVIARRRLTSTPSIPGRSSQRDSTARSTIFISSSAKLAPRQRRRPPPNGIHV